MNPRKNLWMLLRDTPNEGGTGGTAPAAEPAAVPAPAAEPAAAPAAEPAPAAETAPAPAAEEGKKQPPWFQRRINELSAQVAQERAAREAAEAKAAGAAPAPAADNGEEMLPAAEVARRAAALAPRLARQQQFDNDCNAAHAAGLKEFNDFDDNMKTLAATGFLGTPEALEAAVAVQESHKVLQHLGKNPDEATRLLGLSPMARAVALAQISMDVRGVGKPPATKKASGAPAPINPLSGGTQVAGELDLYDPAVPTDTWMKTRDKQVAARRK